MDRRPKRVGDERTSGRFVYLLRSGKHYKVGYTLDVGRRRYDLAIRLPEPVEEVHVLRTDDPAGVERYWHERFARRRKNGEWLDLTRTDITESKRRKFMSEHLGRTHSHLTRGAAELGLAKRRTFRLRMVASPSVQVDTRTERIVCAATEATARAIQSAGESLRCPFRESDMQRVFLHTLCASLATVDLEAAPREAFAVAWPMWPGVGPVDVALVEPDETRRAFLELKWGRGTLYNCIWDLAKMAAAVTIPEAATAFLIAAAPDSDWAGADGAEYFSSRTHSVVELFEQYPKHWRFWLNDVKTHPAHLPRLVSTTEVAAVPVEVRGEAWTIRCVNVAAAADTGRWWTVGPVEEELGIRDRPAPSIIVPEAVNLADSPHPTESEMQCAEDHRRFDRGDSAALWRLVRNPPRWWRFMWFPGDVDFIGKTLEESWGAEQAELLTITKEIKTQEDLTKAVAAIEAFVGTHPGDPTAISAARNCVYAERSLDSSNP